MTLHALTCIIAGFQQTDTMTAETAPAPLAKFTAGQSVLVRLAADYDCTWTVTIVSRTAKTVRYTVSGYKGEKTARPTVFDGVETFFPLGKYSMAPIARAAR